MALIHLAENARHMGHAEPAALYEAEGAGFDESIDRAVQIASAAYQALEGVQSILPSRDTWVIAAPVLEKQQPTARLEHSSDFPERSRRVGDCAKRPCADHKIKSPIRKWQCLRGVWLDSHGKPHLGHPLFHPRPEQARRIHHGQL
jgi:hypothetical protein